MVQRLRRWIGDLIRWLIHREPASKSATIESLESDSAFRIKLLSILDSLPGGKAAQISYLVNLAQAQVGMLRCGLLSSKEDKEHALDIVATCLDELSQFSQEYTDDLSLY